jgi:L-ribulose-5-phosphate 3-epimerase
MRLDLHPRTGKIQGMISPQIDRRAFLQRTGGFVLGGAAVATGGFSTQALAQKPTEASQAIPLKIGIRAATMRMVGNLEVIRAAAAIPGIQGVELQVTAGTPNLRDLEAVRKYKREANRWGMHIPSLAGVWDNGVQITSPAAAENIRQSIRAAEMLGSSVVLVAFFEKSAPDMAREGSYGPIVAMLREVAPRAAGAGVILGLENSLSPADNVKLIDLVGHPAVRVYYDVHNMATYRHGEQAVPGIKLLGKERICAVHVKNGNQRIAEPGPIDWPAAFRAFNEIGYDGWFVFETSHRNAAACAEDTPANIAFLREHLRMPTA